MRSTRRSKCSRTRASPAPSGDSSRTSSAGRTRAGRVPGDPTSVPLAGLEMAIGRAMSLETGSSTGAGRGAGRRRRRAPLASTARRLGAFPEAQPVPQRETGGDRFGSKRVSFWACPPKVSGKRSTRAMGSTRGLVMVCRLPSRPTINTLAASPASRAAGVMMVARRPGSSCPLSWPPARRLRRRTAGRGVRRRGPCSGRLEAVPRRARVRRAGSRPVRRGTIDSRSQRVAARGSAQVAGWGASGGSGSATGSHRSPPHPRARDAGRFAPRPGRPTSYASRLMFSRCRGEMLSDVMLPPKPPQPSVIAGSSPVVSRSTHASSAC